MKAIPLLFTLFLACCSRGSLIFLVAEPYWQSLGDSGGAVGQGLLASAHARGLGLTRVVIGISENAADRLAGALARYRAVVVVVGPPLSFKALDLAALYPSTRFILIDAPQSPSESPNVVRLLFDRTEAFHTMGLAVGMQIKGEGVTEASPAPTGAAATGNAAGAAAAPAATATAPAASAAERLGVAILLPRAASGASDEITAFIKGVKEGSGGTQPTVVTLDEPIDNGKVQKTIQDLRAQGVEFFFPRLGELNPACFDALGASGGYLVTEDWQGSNAHPELVFLSVEEDLAGGVDKCLTASPDIKVIFGPAKVVCGKALPVPKGLSQIECK